jgi:hypothetical protein
MATGSNFESLTRADRTGFPHSNINKMIGSANKSRICKECGTAFVDY